MDKKSSSDKKKSSGNPRIVTMDSIRNAQQDPESQAYFAGGSEHSGQQILGRGKRRNEDPGHSIESGEALAAAFRRRASSSSHAGPDVKTVSFHDAAHLFAGAGHRLGDRDGPEIVEGSAVQLTDHENNPSQVILTLWENGYNLNEGPLLSYDDPQCAELMANIDRGELPSGLVPFEEAPGGPVHLSVVDKRMHKFKKSLTVFGGRGHILGSPTPPMSGPNSDTHSTMSVSDLSTGNTITMESTESLRNDDPLNGLMRFHHTEHDNQEVIYDIDDDSSTSDDVIFVPNEEDIKVFEGSGQVLKSGDIPSAPNLLGPQPSASGSDEMYIMGNVDFSSDSENSTIIKIRLPDSQTVQLMVNCSSSVEQLREYIRQCVPSLMGIDFTLHLTYPRRELRDEEIVESSKLNNSVLVLRV